MAKDEVDVFAFRESEADSGVHLGVGHACLSATSSPSVRSAELMIPVAWLAKIVYKKGLANKLMRNQAKGNVSGHSIRRRRGALSRFTIWLGPPQG